MKVAAIQHDICWEDAAATRAHLAPLVAQAAAAGARLVALTEMFATGFSMHPERVAEPEAGPTESWLREQARARGCWLVGSIPQWELTTADPAAGQLRARNVAVLAGPAGQLHRYAKIHPFSYAGEHEHYAPGTELVTVDVEGVRVSLFVCYDLRFADEFWALAPGTDLYVVVANWPAARRAHWSALLAARAIENQAYVLGVNRVGVGNKTEYLGDSAILDPLGRTLAAASVGESVLVAEVEPAQVTAVRADFPFLRDRRPVGAAAPVVPPGP